MKCPMRFGNPRSDAGEDCIGSRCAWWLIKKASTWDPNSKNVECCAVAFAGLSGPGNRENWEVME